MRSLNPGLGDYRVDHLTVGEIDRNAFRETWIDARTAIIIRKGELSKRKYGETVARIGYHVRTGGHNLTLYDWNRCMDFADEHLGKK